MRLPGINHLDAVRAFAKVGFVVKRQGKHIVLSNGERILIVPRNNPVKPLTMGSIVKASGLTLEEFKRLL